MSSQGLSQVLPYKFRNTGSKPSTITNLYSAPPLKIVEIQLPFNTDVSAIISHADGQPRVIHTTSSKYLQCKEIAQLLSPEQEDLIFWEVGVWDNRLDFNFRDREPQTSKPKTVTTSRISFHVKAEISFEIIGQEYETVPERHLICSYGENRMFGRSGHLSEYSKTSGVQSAIFYPDAKLRCLRLIADQIDCKSRLQPNPR